MNGDAGREVLLQREDEEEEEEKEEEDGTAAAAAAAATPSCDKENHLIKRGSMWDDLSVHLTTVF